MPYTAKIYGIHRGNILQYLDLDKYVNLSYIDRWNMELITEADKVVRTFLPVVLEAAGRVECARELRDSDPLKSPKSVIKAAIILNEMSQIEYENSSWQEIVESALFWCEAAVWAAARKD